MKPEMRDTAYMLDPWYKNPVKGKVVVVGPLGCTVECAVTGVRYYGDWSRCYTGNDLLETPRNPDGSKFKW